MASDARTFDDEATASTGGTSHSADEAREIAIQWVLGRGYAERHVLTGARLLVGRGPDCHLRLDHASISRKQAELYRQGPIYAIRDLGSTNGTHLNGRRTEHAAISPGDVLRVGDYVGFVQSFPRSVEPVPFGELAPGLYGGTTLALALRTAKGAASTDIPIVLVGETGVGKERVARAIHHWSGRAGRFHALNCSALPVGLAEAELFGHHRGAYTGADRMRDGYLRSADGGTLFFDEIAELPLKIQAKLLRVIEERQVTPLGDVKNVSADARVVVATHEPLENFVARGTFRPDLYERLAGFRVDVPALRCRRDEIPGLFFHWLKDHSSGRSPGVEAKLLESLSNYAWPGNARQLELFTRKLLALHGDDEVLLQKVALELLGRPTGEPTTLLPSASHLDRREHDLHLLNAALQKNRGNMTAAAKSAGISRRRAYRLLAESRGNGRDGVASEDEA